MQRQHCIKLELEKAMDEARAMMAQLDRATQVQGEGGGTGGAAPALHQAGALQEQGRVPGHQAGAMQVGALLGDSLAYPTPS